MPPRFTFTFNKQGKLKEETETLETIKQSHDIIHISEDEIDEDDLPTDEPDVVAKPETKKSRKGRPIKTPHHIDDFVAGSELDNLNLRSEKDDDFTSRARITSSPRKSTT